MGKKHKNHTNSAVTVPCHEGVREIVGVGKSKVYAGKFSDVSDFNDWALMIELSDRYGTISTEDVVTVNKEARDMLPAFLVEVPRVPIIRLNWPDYGTPRLSREWWLAFVKFLEGQEGDIGVGCTGGHGRTGTFLSILIGLTEPEVKNPVAEVRERHCKKAVESNAQIRYIQRMVGFDFDEKPASYYFPVVPACTSPGYSGGNGWTSQIDDTKPLGKQGTVPTQLVDYDDEGIWEKDSRGVWRPKDDPYSLDY